jgi:hypothetical protein
MVLSINVSDTVKIGTPKVRRVFSENIESPYFQVVYVQTVTWKPTLARAPADLIKGRIFTAPF